MALASALANNNALAGIFAAAQPTPSTTNTWGSLHTATTGTTGASEYAGVTLHPVQRRFTVGGFDHEHSVRDVHHLGCHGGHPLRDVGCGQRRQLPDRCRPDFVGDRGDDHVRGRVTDVYLGVGRGR